ncbi:protein of unknown function [Ralstonia solanacearum CMR15]|nr:protein of unknown function [Ralstonia solanacearum CMR15]
MLPVSTGSAQAIVVLSRGVKA